MKDRVIRHEPEKMPTAATAAAATAAAATAAAATAAAINDSTKQVEPQSLCQRYETTLDQCIASKNSDICDLLRKVMMTNGCIK